MIKRMALFIFLFLLFTTVSLSGEPKFYEDDPVWKETDSQDASGVKEYEIDLVYDLVENLFTKPGDKTPNVRAQNINSVDEVPDSSWFTNRVGMKKLTAEDVARGPNTTNGPASGTWTIVAGKNDGVTPGFTIEDSAGIKWFIKPDPPGYPAMATGAEVTTTKLFWAFGYHVPENHIATMRVEDLQISEKATVKTPAGNRRKMKEGDIKTMLRRAARNADGTYRVHASRALPGETLGGFRFYGTRPDDPNDVIPHEHRRELRGYFVVAAWLNHVDLKSLQSMDTLIRENGKAVVRHHLLDFSSALGSGSIHPHAYWEGYENLMEKRGHIGKDTVAFGFLVEPYRTDPFFKSPAAGRMPSNYNEWDPESWHPRVPNAAFRHARIDDKFWAARKVVAITDDMIQAAIRAGQFNDATTEEFLANALIARRNAIGRRYLAGVNPVVNPSLSNEGVLAFGNVAVDAGFAQPPDAYQVLWHKWNNGTGQAERLGGSTGPANHVNAPSGLPQQTGTYIKVEISAKSAQNPSWESPVYAYFKRTDGGWKLVGLERTPGQAFLEER